MKGLFGKYLIFASLLLVSCQKPDEPVSLPDKGEAEYVLVELGEDYLDQLFFDFETNRVVHISKVSSWDLAFDASPTGYHVFMNGGGDVFLHNTHETDFDKVTTAPSKFSTEDWMFDRPCGLGDSTAMGDWRNPNGMALNEIYIAKLKINSGTDVVFKKFRMVLADGSRYVMEYADLDETTAHTITIPKDEKYNYSYFSFAEGGKIVQPDPPKDTWDIVFTRYRYVYYGYNNGQDFAYMVTGVLTNPYNTTTAADSTKKFAELNGEEITKLKYSNHRDVIGFDWKEYSLSAGAYNVNTAKNYVIKNRRGQYWKIHFLDYYNKQGVKGSPSFEFQRAF